MVDSVKFYLGFAKTMLYPIIFVCLQFSGMSQKLDHVSGETGQASDTAQQDDWLTLGWKELYEGLQVHEYYPVDVFLVSVQLYISCCIFKKCFNYH